MPWLFDDASFEGAGGTIPFNDLPFSIGAWVYVNDVAIEMCAVGAGHTANDTDFFMLTVNGDQTGDPVRAVSGQGGSSAFAETTTGVTVNTWHHICAVFAGEADRRVFIDGGSKGTNTDSITEPAILFRSSIGLSDRQNDSLWFSGAVAYAFWYFGTLTDAEVAEIANGSMFLPAYQGFVYPMNEDNAGVGEINSWDQTGSMTATGAVQLDSPAPIYMPTPRRIIVPGGAAPAGPNRSGRFPASLMGAT